MYCFPGWSRLPKRKIELTHLKRMTDDTGIVEHALGNIPRRGEGYATDDNARALWLTCNWQHRIASDPAMRGEAEELQRLAEIYLSFLCHAQQPDGHFHNNYSYDRSPEAEEPSDDCFGRSLWGCAVASLNLPHPDSRFAAATLFQNGFRAAEMLKHLRGKAYTLAATSLLLSCNNELSHLPRFQNFIREQAPERVEALEAQLLTAYEQNADGDWQWFEPMMTYGNGVLPWALFHSYQVTGNSDALLIAEETLDFLIDKMTGEEGRIRPIGNRTWCTPDHCDHWDQQPLEVMKLALAAGQAYAALSNPEHYLSVIKRCRAWFHGENDLQQPLADFNGGCHDGLEPSGMNRNQGAESTIAYLMTELIYASSREKVLSKA